HHERLRASGQVVTNGPVIEPPDPSLRGLTFYRTGSLAEARRLAEADPAVRAGRLIVQIMTWYCPPGTMGKAGRACQAEIAQARLQSDARVRVAVGDQRRADLPVIRLEDRIELGAVTRPEHLQREAGVRGIVVCAADQGERPDADPLALDRGQRALR